MKKYVRTLIVITFIIIMLSSLSLSQEKPDTFEETQEEPQPSETPNEEDHEGKRMKKTVYNVDAQGNNESTYYMNTRPGDFIQVRNTNGTEINEKP